MKCWRIWQQKLKQLARPQWHSDKLPPNVNTAWALQVPYYFVTNISSNICTSSFSPSIYSGITCTVVDSGQSSHHLIISVRDYAMLNTSFTNTSSTRLTSTLYMVIILSDSYWLILPVGSFIILTQSTHPTSHTHTAEWRQAITVAAE